jgi:hypothetical protein
MQNDRDHDEYDDADTNSVENNEDLPLDAMSDEAGFASDETAIDDTDVDENFDENLADDAAPVTSTSAAGGNWDDFQFDSPELAAYASYAAYADELAHGTEAAQPEIDETEFDDEYVEEDAGEYDEYDDAPEFPYQPEQLVLDPALDIDAALAAVGALPDLIAERDAAYEVERQRQQEITRAAEERERWRAGYRFARPPQMRLQRGQPASVIPALILIAVGAYLTFALTLSQTPPAPGMIALLVTGAVGVTLLSYWLNARRWARGALFGGLLLMLSGATFYAITTPSIAAALPTGLLAGSGWRLFIGAAFAALTLSGILARPVSFGLAVLGLGGLLGIALSVLINSGALNSLNLNFALLLNEGWKVVLPLVGVLLVIGLFQRVRQRRQLPEAEIPAA